jgi:hypothetical protein
MGTSFSSGRNDFLSSLHQGPFVPTASDARHALALFSTLLPPELALVVLEYA